MVRERCELVDLKLHNRGSYPIPMVILCLVAAGLCLTVFSFIFFRDTGDGYQDELGFHEESKTDADI